MSNNYRGGGRGRGRSSSRGGRSSSHGRGGGGGGGGGHYTGVQARLRPCKTWMQTGSCPHGTSCSFAHVVQLHATVEASSFVNKQENSYNPQGYQGSQQTKASLQGISIWETNNQIKIFTGSADGFWRLWNSATGFSKEFECSVGQRVECLSVVNNHLFVGMQSLSRAVPDVPVGMLHAWNLSSPNLPPLELQVDQQFLPYAANQSVTALAIKDTVVVTGSKDGSIRTWQFNNTAFVLDQTIMGHAREITGLVIVDGRIWSASTDGCIRIWESATGKCQYLIAKAPASPQPGQPPPGHTNAVTALETFHSPAGTFVLSSSLDGTIKAWNGTTGECVASESHGEGVVSITIAAGDAAGQTQVLLVGLESGNIVCRNLVQTPKAAAFEALFVLTSRYASGHTGAVKCVTAGPSATFYSGGADGNMMVWQINGDLGIM